MIMKLIIIIREYIYNPSKSPFEKGDLWQGVVLLAYGDDETY